MREEETWSRHLDSVPSAVGSLNPARATLLVDPEVLGIQMRAVP